MPSPYLLIRARVNRALFRSRAYKRLFGDPKTGGQLSGDGAMVLAHLKRFAKYGKPPVANDRTGATDMFEVGRMVGRQETVQLIVEALHLDEKTLTNLQEDLPNE
jgi:hypothetical protein